MWIIENPKAFILLKIICDETQIEPGLGRLGSPNSHDHNLDLLQKYTWYLYDHKIIEHPGELQTSKWSLLTLLTLNECSYDRLHTNQVGNLYWTICVHQLNSW